MKFVGKTSEFLILDSVDNNNIDTIYDVMDGGLSILWFESNNSKMIIDGIVRVFNRNEIVFLTEFHKVKVETANKIRLVRFNRPFYCVLDHDAEVGCKGVLFFGASQLPVIQLPLEELEGFEILWKMFNIEMTSNDNLQIDMLQMMLKRYLIKCTRIFKSQSRYPTQKVELDTVREFNFLIEQHYKTKHSVSEYADLLNKSPKTISNIFSKLGTRSALQYIQDRRLLEAKRLLFYSDKQIQEIAFEIGFEDIQAFSRFFKNHGGVSPSMYRLQVSREILPTV